MTRESFAGSSIGEGGTVGHRGTVTESCLFKFGAESKDGSRYNDADEEFGAGGSGDCAGDRNKAGVLRGLIESSI